METSVEQAAASTLVYLYMMIHESSQKTRKERKGKERREIRVDQFNPNPEKGGRRTKMSGKI